MRVYLASIEHKEGMNLYAARTPEELTKKIYDYVNFSWYEIFEINPGCPADMDEAIDIYFDTRGDEWLSFDEDTLSEPDAAEEARENLWGEFSVYYDYDSTLMNKIEEKIDELDNNAVANLIGDFNEVTYAGDAGHSFLTDLLESWGIDPDEDEDETETD